MAGIPAKRIGAFPLRAFDRYHPVKSARGYRWCVCQYSAPYKTDIRQLHAGIRQRHIEEKLSAVIGLWDALRITVEPEHHELGVAVTKIRRELLPELTATLSGRAVGAPSQ